MVEKLTLRGRDRPRNHRDSLFLFYRYPEIVLGGNRTKRPTHYIGKH